MGILSFLEMFGYVCMSVPLYRESQRSSGIIPFGLIVGLLHLVECVEYIIIY